MRDLRAARVRGRLLRAGSVSGHVPLVLADPNAVPHHRSPQRLATAPPRARNQPQEPPLQGRRGRCRGPWRARTNRPVRPSLAVRGSPGGSCFFTNPGSGPFRVRGRLLRPGSVSGHAPLVLADPNAVPHHRSPQRIATAPPRPRNWPRTPSPHGPPGDAEAPAARQQPAPIALARRPRQTRWVMLVHEPRTGDPDGTRPLLKGAHVLLQKPQSGPTALFSCALHSTRMPFAHGAL